MPGSRYQLADTQRLADESRREQQRLVTRQNRFAGALTRYLAAGEHRGLGFGEAVVCDPSAGPVTVRLPRIGHRDIGHPITIINGTASTAAITAIAAAGATINGAASYDASGAWNHVTLVPVTREIWIARGAVASATPSTLTPLWEWNGTDLAQFGSPTSGSGVAAIAASVVTALGVSWIELAHTKNPGVGLSGNQYALLPILASAFGSADYRLEADIYVAQAPSNGGTALWGLAARMDPTGGSTTCGTGYAAIHRPNTTPTGRNVVAVTSTSQTSLRNEASTGAGVHTAATDLDTIALSVNGPDIVADITGIRIGAVSSTYTAEQRGGLISGMDNGNSGSQCLIRYRNVRAWAV
jgi:hypothetical protein